MAWAVIEKFQQWSSRRQELLGSLVGIAVEGAASSVPVVGTVAGKVLGELARYGVKRLLEPQTAIPDVKEAGKPFPTEQLDQINGWLEVLTTSYAGLLDRLEPLLMAGNQSTEQLNVLVKQALLERAELVQEFDACVKEVRRATLSLALIEDKLDRNFHEIQRVALAQEEIKAILIDSPLLADYARFRQAQPDALDAIVQADAHFLAGRRDEGIAVLLGLLQKRGVGGDTVCHKLGLAYLGAGQVAEAARVLDQAVPAAGGRRRSACPARDADPSQHGRHPGQRCAGLAQPAARLRGRPQVPHRGRSRPRRHGQRLPGGRRGPGQRGAGRGRQGARPRPDARRARPRPEIVQTLGYEVFDDPHSGGEMYGLVLEYIDGWSLARVLAERQARQQPLSFREIVAVLRPVCRALDFAHGQDPPVLHRDVKPANVMVGRGGKPIKLMDFGIARVLEDCRQTWTGRGEPVGTPAYMPPEFWDPQAEADVRSDVYLAGNLLQELLTFHPQGVLKKRRPDCPKGWADLIHEAMSRDPERRPASMGDFLARLEEGRQEPPPPEGGSPVPAQPVQAPPKKPPEPLKEVVNSVGMKLVRVPRGSFWMGDRGSQQQVEIARDFYIGIYPVAQEQWQAVMGSNPSYFSPSGGGAARVKGISDADLKQFPVEQVSWDDVQEFLKRLNAREKQRGLLYRLPAEAEWEYACRGGATSQQDCAFDFYLAQPSNDLSSAQANFNGNYPAGNAPKSQYLERTTKVGSYQPNRLGIYDMHGNVWEWCEDHFEMVVSARVFRGGGWDYSGRYCRASLRYGSLPSYRINYLGVRLAAVLSE
jgi:formylglycine-generating enzyme required for sulfatase activity